MLLFLSLLRVGEDISFDFVLSVVCAFFILSADGSVRNRLLRQVRMVR